MKARLGILSLSQERVKKLKFVSLSKPLFLCAVAALPIQLNKFFFNSHSYVLGIPIDYRAPAVYFSDLLIILAIIFFLFEHRAKLPSIFSKNVGFILPLSSLVLYLTLNAFFFSQDKVASLTFALTIIEMSIFSTVALYYFSQKNVRDLVSKILKFTVIWQGSVAALQFTFQKSLGLYLLGERSFDVSTSQVASANIFGREVLRSYGTFPHPNVLAAFLLIAIVVTNPKININLKNKKNSSLHRLDNITVVLATVGILTTFSKTTLILALAYLVLRVKKPIVRMLLFAFSALALISYFVFFTQTYIDTVAERILLSQAALDITHTHPLTGVGSANFIPSLAEKNIISIGQVRLLQPAHNVFLLILSENGLPGLLIFTFLLFKLVEKVSKPPGLFLSIALLVYLSIDHFFWTLHQGQMLFFLTAALIYSCKKVTIS